MPLYHSETLLLCLEAPVKSESWGTIVKETKQVKSQARLIFHSLGLNPAMFRVGADGGEETGAESCSSSQPGRPKVTLLSQEQPPGLPSQ